VRGEGRGVSGLCSSLGCQPNCRGRNKEPGQYIPRPIVRGVRAFMIEGALATSLFIFCITAMKGGSLVLENFTRLEWPRSMGT
jgi:hypothetical protein